MTRMATQIVAGPAGGVIGYRYSSLPVVLDLVGVPAGDRESVFEDFQVLEREVVRLMNERANRGK